MTTIEVTQQDIDNANEWRKIISPERGITYNCPVSRAFQRVTKDKHAYWGYTMGEAGDRTYEAVESTMVRGWVHNWDAKLGVKPFQFRTE